MTISKIPKKYRDAHDAAFANWQLVKKSKMCGCICCCRTYSASDVVDWCNEQDGNRTAICPRCDVDSVIPDASGWSLDEEFLTEMKRWWF